MDTYTVMLIGTDVDGLVGVRVSVDAASEGAAHRKVWAMLSPDAQRRVRIVTDWDDSTAPESVHVSL